MSLVAGRWTQAECMDGTQSVVLMRRIEFKLIDKKIKDEQT